jgi:tRNA(Ile)-lysidine synthase TilS/MesJ
MHRYAYFKKLDYFSTECIYSPDAYRGHARAFLKDLESARPSAIIDIIHSGEAFAVKEEVKATQKAQRESRPWIPHFLGSSSYTTPQKRVSGVGTCRVTNCVRHVRCWKAWSEVLLLQGS